MKFLRLADNLISPLFENEEILAFDKPYGINTHTNDSKIEHSEFIQDGLIEMLEKLMGKKLHIIHRLDQTTTGVIIFGKSVQAAKKYSEFFFNREVKKTYWFVTGSRSKQTEFSMDDDIIHKGKNLEARTQFQFLKRVDHYELWQAKPYTGRNHQIRIHAKSGGLPILGDGLYKGAPYPFLCLHNHRIEFPNGIIISSKAPLYYEDLNLLKDVTLARALFEADRRLRIFSGKKDASFRWVHAKDFSLDQFRDNLVLNWDKESWTETDQKRFMHFAEIMKRNIIIRVPQIPTPAHEWLAHENGYDFQCRTNSGPNVGLFLNQRLQRNWVHENVTGKSVLNVFANNCGFGLAAAGGKASEVISVESNAKLLNWGKSNFKLNALESERFKFLCRDSLVFLKQIISKNSKFDLVICDAPSFYRGEKAVFKIEKDLQSLLESCLQCVKPEGHLLFSTAHEGFFVDDLRQSIAQAQKSLKLSLNISSIQSALDFELPEERAKLKSFLIQRLS